MSIEACDTEEGAFHPNRLVARVTAAQARGRARLSLSIDDFYLPDDARLDDRMRSGIAATLVRLIDVIEHAIRSHAARLLSAQDLGSEAERLIGAGPGTTLDRLVTAGLLRDSCLMRELIDRAREDAIGDALPPCGPLQPDTPSLLSRLANHPDSVVAAAANALFAAEGRRRGLDGGNAQIDLPAELHQCLVWWVAAALYERYSDGDHPVTVGLALQDAALRSLSAHDESDRSEAVAMQLAAAYEPSPLELPGMLVEALGDRRIALFTALVAHALGLDYAEVRNAVVDPHAELLWLMLRALDMGRPPIARIAVALSEADERRDLEAFADVIDNIMEITPIAARVAIEPMTLHADFRTALSVLASGALT